MTTPGEPASQILLPTSQPSHGAFWAISADADTMETSTLLLLVIINQMTGVSWFAGSRREPDDECWTGGRFLGPVFPDEAHI